MTKSVLMRVAGVLDLVNVSAVRTFTWTEPLVLNHVIDPWHFMMQETKHVEDAMTNVNIHVMEGLVSVVCSV